MKARPCTIAGCIYSALFYVTRPGNPAEVPVCRKCAEELTALYKWKFVRRMSDKERTTG